MPTFPRRTALLVLLLLAGCAAPGRRSPEFVELASAEATIPVSFARRSAIVEARIDGHGPYRLLFDTGADMTVLSPRVAAEIGAPTRTKRVLVHGVHASTLDRFAIARLREVDLGEVRLHGLDALVADAPSACDGLIGLRQFGDLRVSIDFGGGRIAVRETPHDHDPNAAVVPLAERGGVPIVEIELGRTPVRALVDSGFDGAFYLDAADTARMDLEGPPVPLARSTSFGGDTETLAFARLAHPWTWAGITFERPIIAFGGGRPLLGMEVLRHYRIDVDPVARTMRFAPSSADRIETAPLTGPGVVLAENEAGSATVELVVPGSAAERAGVRAGDRVLGASTIVVHGSSAPPVLRLRLARDGEILDIEVPHERFLP